MIKSRPMFSRLIPRKALSCWLVAALLLQSLMPAIAGVRSGDGKRWIEVCVTSGVKWVQMSDASEPQFSHTAACSLKTLLVLKHVFRFNITVLNKLFN